MAIKTGEIKELLEHVESDKIDVTMQQAIEFNLLYDSAIREISTKLTILDHEFKVKYDHNPIHHMESRIKTMSSVYEKLKRKGYKVSLESAKRNLYDIAGMRVICPYQEDIYSIAKMLLKQNDIRLVEMKDYIKNPKKNGYRSLHLVVEIPVFLSNRKEKVPVEIQIRTIAMDFWASLEHQLRYKNKKAISKDISERLAKCSKQIHELDEEMQDIYRLIKEIED